MIESKPGSGRPVSGALPPKTAPEQPGEPRKMGAHGVGGGLEARAGTAPTPPSTPPLLRYGGVMAERPHR